MYARFNLDLHDADEAFGGDDVTITRDSWNRDRVEFDINGNTFCLDISELHRILVFLEAEGL